MYDPGNMIDFFAIHAGHEVRVRTVIEEKPMCIIINAYCSCGKDEHFEARYFDSSRYRDYLKRFGKKPAEQKAEQ